MFKVVAVAPPISTPSLYHWLPLPASLVSTIAADPSHTVNGPAGVTFGVVGTALTVMVVLSVAVIPLHPARLPCMV
jgi:hypothetical protein